MYTTILVVLGFGVQRTDFSLRRDFEFHNISANLESWRAISLDPSQIMFKENIDFDNMKIATLNRAILFISKGVSGEILSIFQGFVMEELDHVEGNYF